MRIELRASQVQGEELVTAELSPISVPDRSPDVPPRRNWTLRESAPTPRPSGPSAPPRSRPSGEHLGLPSPALHVSRIAVSDSLASSATLAHRRRTSGRLSLSKAHSERLHLNKLPFHRPHVFHLFPQQSHAHSSSDPDTLSSSSASPPLLPSSSPLPRQESTSWEGKDLVSWNHDDILAWLQHLGLDSAASLIVGFELCGKDVAGWDWEGLDELGLTDAGTKGRLLREVAGLLGARLRPLYEEVQARGLERVEAVSVRLGPGQVEAESSPLGVAVRRSLCAALRPGHVILEADGQPLHHPQHLDELLRRRAADGPVRLVLLSPTHQAQGRLPHTLPSPPPPLPHAPPPLSPRLEQSDTQVLRF